MGFQTTPADGGDGSAGAGHDARDRAAPTDAPADPSASSSAGSGYRVRWARLLARVFQHDMVRCDHCGARRTVFAARTSRVRPNPGAFE